VPSSGCVGTRYFGGIIAIIVPTRFRTRGAEVVDVAGAASGAATVST
jgi:hypothetical protein